MTNEPINARAARKPYVAPKFAVIMHHRRTQATMNAGADGQGNQGS